MSADGAAALDHKAKKIRGIRGRRKVDISPWHIWGAIVFQRKEEDLAGRCHGCDELSGVPRASGIDAVVPKLYQRTRRSVPISGPWNQLKVFSKSRMKQSRRREEKRKGGSWKYPAGVLTSRDLACPAFNGYSSSTPTKCLWRDSLVERIKSLDQARSESIDSLFRPIVITMKLLSIIMNIPKTQNPDPRLS